MLCSSKCNVSENFEADINIMYRTAKSITSEEKKIEIIIFDDLMNENILKLSDFEMIMILMKIVWQQKMKAIANKFNKLSNETIEEDEMRFEKCSLQQQCVW